MRQLYYIPLKFSIMLKHFVIFSNIFLAEMVRKEGKSGNTQNLIAQKALKDFSPSKPWFYTVFIVF